MATLLQTATPWTRQQLEEDATERKRIVQQVLKDAPARLAAELSRMRKLGVIDEDGNRIATGLPADMLPGAERDFGG
jgi:hypothetical protein